MNSFLLITRDPEATEEQALSFLESKGIQKIDITLIDAVPEKPGAKKGIGLIREVIRSIALKPISGDKKAVVILNSHLLSAPAQNALLKTLEEPPESTLIVLTSENEFSLLPTIRSRCQIIKDYLSEEKNTEDLEDFEDLGGLEKAEALAKSKQAAISFLERKIKELEKLLYEKIEKDSSGKTVFETKASLVSYLQAYNIVKTTNTNLRLTLENLFLK